MTATPSNTGADRATLSTPTDQQNLTWQPGFGRGQYAGAIMGYAMSCADPIFLDPGKLADQYQAHHKTVYRTLQRLVDNGYLERSGRAHFYTTTLLGMTAGSVFQRQTFTMRPGCTPLESVVGCLALRMKSRSAAAAVLGMSRTGFLKTLARSRFQEAQGRTEKVTPRPIEREHTATPRGTHGDTDFVFDCDPASGLPRRHSKAAALVSEGKPVAIAQFGKPPPTFTEINDHLRQATALDRQDRGLQDFTGNPEELEPSRPAPRIAERSGAARPVTEVVPGAASTSDYLDQIFGRGRYASC